MIPFYCTNEFALTTGFWKPPLFNLKAMHQSTFQPLYNGRWETLCFVFVLFCLCPFLFWRFLPSSGRNIKNTALKIKIIEIVFFKIVSLYAVKSHQLFITRFFHFMPTLLRTRTIEKQVSVASNEKIVNKVAVFVIKK